MRSISLLIGAATITMLLLIVSPASVRATYSPWNDTSGGYACGGNYANCAAGNDQDWGSSTYAYASGGTSFWALDNYTLPTLWAADVNRIEYNFSASASEGGTTNISVWYWDYDLADWTLAVYYEPAACQAGFGYWGEWGYVSNATTELSAGILKDGSPLMVKMYLELNGGGEARLYETEQRFNYTESGGPPPTPNVTNTTFGSRDYCLDNMTLIRTKIVFNSTKMINTTEYVYCENGCSESYDACMVSPLWKYLLFFAGLIGFMVLVILLRRLNWQTDGQLWIVIMVFWITVFFGMVVLSGYVEPLVPLEIAPYYMMLLIGLTILGFVLTIMS